MLNLCSLPPTPVTRPTEKSPSIRALRSKPPVKAPKPSTPIKPRCARQSIVPLLPFESPSIRLATEISPTHVKISPKATPLLPTTSARKNCKSPSHPPQATRSPQPNKPNSSCENSPIARSFAKNPGIPTSLTSPQIPTVSRRSPANTSASVSIRKQSKFSRAPILPSPPINTNPASAFHKTILLSSTCSATPAKNPATPARSTTLKLRNSQPSTSSPAPTKTAPPSSPLSAPTQTTRPPTTSSARFSFPAP